MADSNLTFLNTGIYTLPDAARLTGVSTGRIRRWLRGYRFRSRANKQYHSPPLWRGQLEPNDNSWALGFLDLIEIKFVDAFLRAGVGWAMVRKAHERSGQLFKQSHPFCTNRFATDGREIFVKLHEQTGEESLIEIVRNQKVFSQIVRPFFKELEFDAEDVLVRWRPMTARRLIVLDPTRSFGHPIVIHHGVPTEVIAKAAAVSSIKEVSRWYELSVPEIEDAVEFERKLAA